MAIVNTHYGFCAKGGAVPKFTYTGEYNVRDDGVVELLTSGTLVFLNPAVIDVFCVGGGGAGGSFSAGGLIQRGAPGGAGGYTATVLNQSVAGSYTIIIGEGGRRGPLTEQRLISETLLPHRAETAPHKPFPIVRN